MTDFRRGKPLSDNSIIERFEAEKGVTLPEDYKAIVRENDGAFPKPCCIPVRDPKHGEQYYACGQLLTFEGDASIFMMNDGQTAGMVPGLIAFGGSSSGILFCFDYRVDETKPSVVVVTREEGVDPIPASASFTDLVDSFVHPSWELERMASGQKATS